MKRLVLFCVLFFALEAQGRGALYGKVVIIDPGHGGEDPGSSGIHSGKRVFEDEYNYDVALRIAKLVKQNGGLAFLTVVDPNQRTPRDWKPQEVFPADYDERFASDGTRAVARTRGMQKRLALANQLLKKYPRHRIAWISIHFDVVGRNAEIQGVRIINGNGDTLPIALQGAFGKRLREVAPVVGNGDRDHGIRKLYVLSKANKVKSKVLIELGNFRNRTDLWRIRNPVVREAYARAIVEGLAKW